MLKIGLTGGIGSGKSAAAKYFAKLKIPIIDADKIAHRLILPKTTIYKKIITHFGTAILSPKKLINRKKLRKIIFNNKTERVWLEKILHPSIVIAMNKNASKSKAPYCIMVIPLLFETKSPITVDRILVVDCPKKLQIKRIQHRDRSDIKQIQTIIQSQASRGLRLKIADDIIYNTGSLKDLEKKVKKLHSYYLSIS